MSERCPTCGQPDNCGDCDHTIVPESFAKAFRTPYRQYADRRGETFAVVRIITEAGPNFDEEVLPMYEIRFADGKVINAWPEEVLEPLPSEARDLTLPTL